MGNSARVTSSDKIRVSVSLSLSFHFLTMPSVSLLPPSHHQKCNSLFFEGRASIPNLPIDLNWMPRETWFLSDHWYSAKIPTTWLSTVSFPQMYVLNSNMGWILNFFDSHEWRPRPNTIKRTGIIWSWTDQLGLPIQVYPGLTLLIFLNANNDLYPYITFMLAMDFHTTSSTMYKRALAGITFPIL